MKNIRINITRTTIAIFIILVCALILRLYNLNKYDLWFDELGPADIFLSKSLAKITISSVVSVFSLMVDKMKDDPHSSFYYLLAYIYSILFGDGKAVRVLSVIFSMLSLGVFYKLSRLFFNRRVSVYALLIMAIHPFHIWYAQEARAYAMACFFSLLMTYLYMRALETEGRVYWICFPIAGILSVYSSYHSGLLLIALGVTLFFKNNLRYTKKWFLSLLIISIFLLFLLPILINQLSFVKNSFWLSAPSRLRPLFTLMIFNLGYSASSIQHYWIGLGLFLILFIYGTYSYYRTNKANTIILLLFLFLPIITIYIFSHLIMPIYIDRQLLIFSPFYYLFIAQGIESIKNRQTQILAVICTVVLMATSLINYYRGFMLSQTDGKSIFADVGVHSKKNYSDLIIYMGKEFKKGDLVVAGDLESYILVLSYIKKYHKQCNYIPIKMLRFLFYPRLLTRFDRSYLGIDELIDNMPADELEKLHDFAILPNGKIELKQDRLYRNKFIRIWLILSSWDKEGRLCINSSTVRAYMSRNFKRVSLKKKDGTYLELYAEEDLHK